MFGDATTFSYDDGTNHVSSADFATFQTANQTHGWGFDLSNCQVENEANIYVGAALDNFAVQQTSVAVGMATNSSVVGAFKVGSQVLATDAGWQNNTGFTLNVDQYETNTTAEIESPVFDFGMNKPIYHLNTGLTDAFEDGRLLNHLGQLGPVILSGGTQSGLTIGLTEGAVYSIDGFIEVVTSQRTLTITSQQCFTALANEEIQEVTAASSGEVREVIYLDGKLRVQARWWKDGEAEPNTWEVVTRDQPVLVDANGRGNGDPSYDANAFPRHPVGRYLRLRPVVTTNNLKS